MSTKDSLEIIEETSKNTKENSKVESSSQVLQQTTYISSTVKKPVPLQRTKLPVRKQEEEQIEEFDTDEEEETEQNKDNAGQQEYSDFLSYEGDKCVYTEPDTGRKLIWDTEKNAWCNEKGEKVKEATSTNESIQNYEFDGQNYVYTDKKTNVTYKFVQESNEWVVKEGTNSEESIHSIPETAIYGFEDDTHTYTDPKDGSVYMWDHEKNAWFPKVDEDFMARYQMSYGFVDPNKNSKTPEKNKKQPKEETLKKGEAKRKAPEPPSWFEVDDSHNTAIYVSGLPLDVTLEELTELFSKCGLLARDEKGKDKIKLYKDSSGELKGDALCTYIKVESVDLALKILDGSQLRGKTLSVQRAKFQLKGKYDPTLKPKRKKKDKEKQKKIQQKLLDWRPDKLPGEPQRSDRVVVIKNLFKPEDFDKEVSLILEYQQDVRSECQKCGEVKKVVIYDRNPEGVAQVTFKEQDAAEACVQLLDGRWFGQRKITAEIWDGKTKYKIAETDAEVEARINKWEKFLEESDEKSERDKEKSSESAQ